ncbi:hypothetical protein RhiirC2_857969 [Rhizophagus irregularis]|uniref:Crinkler effector protein N-terminal domain-containing protein n=1 Tax=Rhizophagus irregularis TaxID=588596 RepID=A0A2N1M8R0_9GLOM|nr:hypothetical protein RhiirC2_857969 [Rhizophagus irregularis]
MSIITLSCLVVSENPYENAFAVEIDTTKLVSFFRNVIKEKNTQAFANVDAKDIKLWKVDISLDEENEKLTAVNTKINVNIKDELAQQPFLSWTFPQIKTLFGLTADSYIDLPKFDGKLADSANYEKILEHVLEDIAMKHKTCIHVTSANEATRREFISSVLHGVTSCYDGEVKVCPEYELSGSHGKGPVDWVIKIGDTIIVIIKAKREVLVRMQFSYKLRLNVIKRNAHTMRLCVKM